MKYLPILVLFLAPQWLNCQEIIYYSSLNKAVRLGQYDGVISLAELKRHGDTGLGSGDRIGSELVMLNDTAYSLAADRRGMIMPPETKLPFAAAKKFRAERVLEIGSPLNLAELQSVLDSVAGTNNFTVFKISGIFESIRYKCYLPQTKPFKPIEEAETKIFDSTAITGDIVGFFTPRSASVLNSPEYHFHFINRARSSGGHVVDLRIRYIRIEIDRADQLLVSLPSDEQLKPFDLNKED